MIAPARRVIRRGVRRSVLGLLFVWVGFWVFFVLASHGAEGGVALLAEGGTVALPLVVLALLSWRRPLWGGVGLVVAGIAAAFVFRHPAAELILALPAALFGAFFTWVGIEERRRA